MTRDDDTDVNDTFLGGKLLIASPSIGDPRFDRTVIMMCDHTAEHAMGLVVNKPIESLRLPDLFEQLEITSDTATPDGPVYVGGPVDRDRGFVLHTPDFEAEGATLPVTEGLGLTATRDVLQAIASAQPPRKSLVALGYAGWGAGQLDEEIAANAWLVADADETLIFSGGAEDKWERALASLGISPEHLTMAAGHA